MLVKTLLIALVSFIGFLECGVGNSMIQRPIVMGPLVGLVLGDVNAGLAVGATLELAFMGNVTIGAALPPEITAGSILGTALAIVSGNGTEAALALALPIATAFFRRGPPGVPGPAPAGWRHCPGGSQRAPSG